MASVQQERSGSTRKDFGSDDIENLLEKEDECYVIETPEIFRLSIEAANKLKKRLNAKADAINKINRKQNEEKARGSLVSLKGSVLGLAGTAAAPFSGGLSFVIAATASYVSYRGGTISSTAENALETQINGIMESCICQVEAFNQQMVELNKIIELINELMKELRELFIDLELEFEKGYTTLIDCTYTDYSTYKIQIFLKCVTNFYAVLKASNFVAKHFESFTKFVTKTQSFKTVLQTGKEYGGLANACKDVALQFGVDQSSTAFSATKEILDTGTKLISTVGKTKNVAKTTKLTSLAADGTAKVTRAKTFGRTATKQTVKATKSVSKAALGFGLVFVAVDYLQYDSASTAAESKCDAEKELRSIVKGIENIVEQANYQTELYKQIMKIQKLLSKIMRNATEMHFGGKLPLQRILSSFCKISELQDKMA